MKSLAGYTLIGLTSLALLACGSGPDEEDGGVNDSQTSSITLPELQDNDISSADVGQSRTVRSLTFTDVGGYPLIDSRVAVMEYQSAKSKSDDGVISDIDWDYETDEDGYVLIDLEPNKSYIALVDLPGVLGHQLITVLDTNVNAHAVILVQAVCNSTITECSPVESEAVLGSVTGALYDGQGPISNTQISVNCTACNGNITTDISDANGLYNLSVNVGGKAGADGSLNDGYFLVFKEGQMSPVRSKEVVYSGSVIGKNFILK